MLPRISWTYPGVLVQSPPQMKGLPLAAVDLDTALHMAAWAFHVPITSPYTHTKLISPAPWVCSSTLMALCGWMTCGQVTLR